VVVVHTRALILGLLLVPLLGALSPVAAQASPGTLHLGSTIVSEPAATAAGCRTVKHYVMDPVADNIPDGKAYWDEISGGLGCAIWFDYVLPVPVTLSGTGQLRFTYGCDAFTSTNGGNDFRVRLYKNGEQASQQDFNVADTCTSAGGVADLSVATADTAFNAGDTLSLGVVSWFINTPSAQMKNLHIKVGPSNPATFTADGLGALLPAPVDAVDEISTEAVILYTEVNGTELRVERIAENLTQSEVHNWTANGTYALQVVSNGTLGNVTLRLVGPDNQTLANATLPTSGNLTQDLVLAGNVSLQLDYVAYTGSFRLDLVPKVSGAETTATSDGNETLDSQSSSTKDAPSAGIVLLLACLALVAALRRRR
jgi:MYXO-CTERM domain-containing protein